MRCARTTSCPARWTAGWPPPSPRPWPPSGAAPEAESRRGQAPSRAPPEPARGGEDGSFRGSFSVALHVDQLPERVPHLDQVSGVLHDDVDRLVGRGDLVEEHVAVPPLDALHRLLEL